MSEDNNLNIAGQSNNNSGDDSGSDASALNNSGVDSSNSATGQGRLVTSSNNSGVSGSTAVTASAGSKKPKTEQQKAKEKERRRRRRRKKKDKPQFVAGQDVATFQIKEPPEANLPIPETIVPEENLDGSAQEIIDSAVDAPLILTESDEDVKLRDETMAKSRPFNENEVNNEDLPVVPNEAGFSPPVEATPQEMTELGIDNQLYGRGEMTPPPVLPPIFDENEADNKNLSSSEPDLTTSWQAENTEKVDLPDSQEIFETGQIAESPIVDVVKPPELIEDNPEKIENVSDLPHESLYEDQNLQKAKELSENLLSEDDGLEELPVKQGILGKLFDSVVNFINGRKKIKDQAVLENIQIKESKSLNLAWLWSFLKYILGIVIIGVMGIAAFWLGSSFKLLDGIGSWFTPKPGLELAVGDNSEVVIDSEYQRKWGYFTAAFFGKNFGDMRDSGFNLFFNANYFGKLLDPVFYGETGISAAIYYGFGKDDLYLKNRFIYYVNFLRRILFANQTKIDDVMNNKLRRDFALDEYTNQIKVLFEEGNKLRKEINVQIDEFKIAYNSLTAEKDRYEVDFFASLNELEGEKADQLLVKFIDITQKQLEVKAKLSALTQLSQNYEDLLIKLKLRIEAIEKNRDALISGVTVVDIPGSDIDLTRE